MTQINPATGQPSGPVSVGSGPAGIAITPAAVWVANSLDLTVSKIDPATGRSPTSSPSMTGRAPSSRPRTPWVSDEFDATLDRIDPRTGQVTRSVFVGSSPQGLAATPSGMWVAARAFTAASHRGGTLTEVNYYLPVPDPAQAADPASTSALATAYDGLVTLRRSGGPPGLTLVPDLAMTLPRPADGGTTYTFTLRRGIRYSNGTLLRASDFRRGIQRQLSFGTNPSYYERILGARHATGTPGGATYQPGSSSTTRPARSPSTWAGPTPTSCTNSRCSSPPRPHPAPLATPSTALRSCPEPGRT